MAADSDAELVIVCAYSPADRNRTAGAEDTLKGEAHLVRGWTPAEDALRSAEDRAGATGAREVRTLAADGAPVEVLRNAVAEVHVDLLVVGDRGLNTLSGRLLGSVPSGVARRAGVDVLIVHTT